MTTSFIAPAQETGGGSLSSREGKRNRKAQALSALLSASALGVFLEGCGGNPDSSSDTGTNPGFVYTARESTGGERTTAHSAEPGEHVTIRDADTATGATAFVAGQENTILFRSPNEASAYSSVDQFAFERSGDNLIITTATPPDGVDPARVTIVDYYSNEEFFIFQYDTRTGDTETPVAFAVPIIGTGEVDTLTASANGDTLRGLGGDDTLTGGVGDDILNGGAGADTLEGGAGADKINGGAGTDTASYTTSNGGVTITLTAGAGSATIAGDRNDANTDTLSGIENLVGSAQGDTLTGDRADNILTGGGGGDTLTGGGGGDTLNGDDGNDMLTGGGGADTLNGGAGTDTAIYTTSAAAVTIDLSATEEVDGIFVSYATIEGDDASNANRDTLIGIENLVGSAADDDFTGDGAANTLSGGAGEDTLEGGEGADTLNGGDGTDTASYATSDAAVTVDLSATEEVDGIFVSYATIEGDDASNPNRDTLIGIENLIGSAQGDTLTGDAANNILTGGDGNDMLMGGEGADTITGGDGTDTASYATSNNGVRVSLALAAEGNAQIARFEGTADDAIGDTLSGIENLVGSDRSDAFTGDGAANTLSGGAGADELRGGGEGDTLNGGEGHDWIDGGAGADRIDGGDGTDTVSYISSGGGVTVSLALGDNEPQKARVQGTADDAAGDTLIGIEWLAGSTFDDTLTGDAAANRLSGGDGNDILIGGEGADTLNGGDGTDTASYATSDNGVTVSLALAAETAQTARVQGTADDAAGDTLALIENLVGSSEGDTLTGNNVANTLSGGAGVDTLNGNYGADTLNGGIGNDNLLGGRGTDTYVFVEGDGTDTISEVVQQDFVNTLKFVGSNYDKDTSFSYERDSNDGTNLVITVETDNSNSEAENKVTLSGYFASATSTDPVYSIMIQLDAGDPFAVPALPIVGSDAGETLPGTTGDDTLRGLGGDDTLNGGEGDDTLEGGTGADTLDGGDGTDTASYATSAAAVTVDLSASTVYATIASDTNNANTDTLINIENLIGSDQGDTLTGDGADNTLSGGGGGDTLTGGGGGDTLRGGVDDDNLNGGAGADTYVFVEGDGEDTITESGTETNTLKFRGSNYDQNDFSSARDGTNLVITVETGSDNVPENKIILSGYFATATSTDPLYSIMLQINDGTAFAVPNLPVVGGGTSDTLTGTAGDDTLRGFGGDDTLIGGAGADTLDGGDGTDTASYATSDNGVTVSLALADQTARRQGTADDAAGDTLIGIENLIGSTQGDTLTGDGAANTLNGSGGDDTLTGGEGDDTLVGETGADTYVFTEGDGADTISESVEQGVVNTLKFVGSNYNKNDFSSAREGANLVLTVDTDSTPEVENKVTLTAYFTNDAISYSIMLQLDDGAPFAVPNLPIVGGGTSDTLGGTTGDDTLRGFGGDDTLSGGNGNDKLYGGADNDILYGGPGADTLDGGAGTDTAIYPVFSSVTVSLVTGAVNTGQDAAGDTLINIENLIGSSRADTLTGNGEANNLNGRSGDDTLTGGEGDDTLVGETGADTYVFTEGDGADTIIEVVEQGVVNTLKFEGNYEASDFSSAREGTNLVLTVDTDSTTEVENKVTLSDYFTSDTSIASLYSIILQIDDGTPFAVPALPAIGGEEGQTFDGTTGDDTLQGLSGDDTLTGGEGDDTLEGGTGADTYVFNEGDGEDTIIESGTETNTLKFVGSNYERSDFTYGRDGTSLVLTVDTDGDGQAENEVTLSGYFTTTSFLDTTPLYSIEIQINDGTAFDTPFST